MRILLAVALVTATADPEEPVDYSTGPYAEDLCQGSGFGLLECRVTRTIEATLQGAANRALVEAQGSECEVQQGLWVCFDVDSVLAQRGGTTYGDTYMTPDSHRLISPAKLDHESEHVRQWRLFGPQFAKLYLSAGLDACDNYFEISAGLADGGYHCD